MQAQIGLVDVADIPPAQGGPRRSLAQTVRGAMQPGKAVTLTYGTPGSAWSTRHNLGKALGPGYTVVSRGCVVYVTENTTI